MVQITLVIRYTSILRGKKYTEIFSLHELLLFIYHNQEIISDLLSQLKKMIVTADWRHGLFRKQICRPFPNSYFYLFYIYVRCFIFVRTSPGSTLNVIHGKQPLNEIVINNVIWTESGPSIQEYD